MTTNSTVIEVGAVIDTDGIDRDTWTAAGVGPTKGFTAVGGSFHEARRTFCEVVALGVISGVIDVGDQQPDAIRVIAQTRKTFPLSELKESTT